MSRARRQPPSRARYAALHPTIGVHTTLEVRDRLLALRQQSGRSFAQLILAALGQIEVDVAAAETRGRQAGRREGLRTGFAKGREKGNAEAVGKFRLTYPCNVCSEPVVVKVGADDADAAMSSLTRGGWGHQTCNESVRYVMVRTNP